MYEQYNAKYGGELQNVKSEEPPYTGLRFGLCSLDHDEYCPEIKFSNETSIQFWIIAKYSISSSKLKV